MAAALTRQIWKGKCDPRGEVRIATAELVTAAAKGGQRRGAQQMARPKLENGKQIA